MGKRYNHDDAWTIVDMRTIPAVTCIILLVPVLLFSLIGGCLDKVSESFEPAASMAVLRTWNANRTDEGWAPVSGHSWTYLEVEMVNDNHDIPISVAISAFYAYTASEERLWAFDGEGLEDPEIAPGSSLIFLTVFMVPEGEVLVKLEYTNTVADPLTCPIP